MRWWLLMLAWGALSTGCAYVTEAEYLDRWDHDGDGWPIGQDCNDDDDRIYPYAPDRRGDDCDADCGRESDRDGDDWPDDADCAPDDPAIHPCSGTDTVGDGIDSDCDGKDTPRAGTCPTDDPDHADAPVIESCETTDVSSEEAE